MKFDRIQKKSLTLRQVSEAVAQGGLWAGQHINKSVYLRFVLGFPNLANYESHQELSRGRCLRRYIYTCAEKSWQSPRCQFCVSYTLRGLLHCSFYEIGNARAWKAGRAERRIPRFLFILVAILHTYCRVGIPRLSVALCKCPITYEPAYWKSHKRGDGRKRSQCRPACAAHLLQSHSYIPNS